VDRGAFGREPRQIEQEQRASLGRFGDGDGPALELGELARDGQAEARPSEPAGSAALDLLEALEHELSLVRGDAGPTVCHLDANAIGPLGKRHADAPACRGELERVRKEVEDDALHLLDVDLGDDPGRCSYLQRDACLRGENLEMRCDPAHEAREVRPGVVDAHSTGL
jgi:hypothetical protein